MFRTLCIWVALATALALPASPSFAQAQGTASLGNLSFTLVDLDPNDGITPSLTWPAWPYSSQNDPVGNGGGVLELRSGGEYHWQQLYQPGPEPLELSLSPNPNIGASAALTQRETPETLEMTLAPYAMMQGGAEQNARIHFYSGMIPFTVSANTRVTFTLDVQASGSVSQQEGMLERFEAYSLFYLIFGDSSDFDSDLFTLSSGEGGAQEADYFHTLTITGENRSIGSMNGYAKFYGVSAALSMWDTSAIPPAIPEPATLPAYAAGLVVIAMWRRRRQRA